MTERLIDTSTVSYLDPTDNARLVGIIFKDLISELVETPIEEMLWLNNR